MIFGRSGPIAAPVGFFREIIIINDWFKRKGFLTTEINKIQIIAVCKQLQVVDTLQLIQLAF